jgi:hypothetical protein
MGCNPTRDNVVIGVANELLWNVVRVCLTEPFSSQSFTVTQCVKSVGWDRGTEAGPVVLTSGEIRFTMDVGATASTF